MMRDPFQRIEVQKAARALNGVNRTEDAGQQVGVFGTLLQIDHFLVKPIEIFTALDDKFSD